MPYLVPARSPEWPAPQGHHIQPAAQTEYREDTFWSRAKRFRARFLPIVNFGIRFKIAVARKIYERAMCFRLGHSLTKK